MQVLRVQVQDAWRADQPRQTWAARHDTCNLLAPTCAPSARRLWPVALSLFEDMRGDGLEPTRITYNAALAACERGGQWEEVRACCCAPRPFQRAARAMRARARTHTRTRARVAPIGARRQRFMQLPLAEGVAMGCGVARALLWRGAQKEDQLAREAKTHDIATY